MTGSPIFSINLKNRKNPSNLNYHISIKKSQAILKLFIDLKLSVWFTLTAQKTNKIRRLKPSRANVVLQSSYSGASLARQQHPTFETGRLLVKIVKTLNERQSALLAESLRSFLDKSGKGKRKEESGRRKEEGGRGTLKSSKCHKTWFRFLSPG